MVCYEALQIPLGGGYTILLEDDSPPPSTDERTVSSSLPAGWAASSGRRTLSAALPRDRPPFCFDASAPDRGLAALRLFELRDYSWRIMDDEGKVSTDVTLTSSLEQSTDRDLWKPKIGLGRFSFVNYLGSA